MNVQKKQTRFRDDLRRLLLIYALLPLFCALLVVFAVMGGLFISNIIHRTDEDRIQAGGDQRALVSPDQRHGVKAAGVDL